MSAGRAGPPGADPLIARIAGLPASSLEPFGSAPAARCLAALAAAEEELARARAEMADRLHDAVPAAAPRLRRVLLAVRRDCHNARSLERHAAAQEWEEIRRIAGPLADRLLELERRAGEEAAELERTHRAELTREVLHLRRLGEDRRFGHGVALAAPLVATSLARLAAVPPEAYGRRESRAVQSLLRYASRAALKLSPYSTLTRVALARAVDGPGAPLRLLGRPAEWREVSLVRARRYLVEQLAQVVLRCPYLRDRLPVRLSSTAVEVEPDRFRLLRPARWEPADGRMRYTPPAVVEVPVSRALVAWLAERLAGGDLTWSALATELAGELGGPPADALRSLEKLRRLGLLESVAPWPADATHLEQALLEALRAAAVEPLAGVASCLASIVEIERGLLDDPDPGSSVERIHELLDVAWREALAAAGLAPEVAPYRGKSREVYEDVLVVGGGPGPIGGELAEARREDLWRVLRASEPWFRLLDASGPRLEVLWTLAAAARERWPGRDEVGLLDVARELGPLFRELQQQTAGIAGQRPVDRPCVNPLGLPRIAELHRVRQGIWRELYDLVRRDGGVDRLCPEELRALLERLPPEAAPAVGPCLFLQPADPAGDLWVLNRIFEGTGRYGSRYTAAMPAAMRGRLTSHLAARSVVRIDGEEVEVLDLLSPHGDTLNVHAVQTGRVLGMPGETLDLPAGRVHDVGSLGVRIDGARPSLVGRDGRRLLPAYLGGAALAFAPPLVQLVAAFGPGEVKPLPLPRRPRRQGEATLLGRLLLGPLVLGRARWVLPAAPLARELAGLSAAGAFRAVDRWRSRHGVPERVFVIERVRHPVVKDMFKPQYVDLGSPAFVALFEAIVRAAGGSLVLEEALPAPSAFPRDAAGEAWAVELQLDSLAWGPPRAAAGGGAA